MQDMTALLSVTHEGKPICISRIDALPSAPHVNVHWRRFGAPSQVDVSHCHPFGENASLGRKAFDPYANLPHAVPLAEEPQHLRDFLQVVEKTFNIEGIADLPPPPTQGSML